MGMLKTDSGAIAANGRTVTARGPRQRGLSPQLTSHRSTVSGIVLVVALMTSSLSQAQDRFAEQRERMVRVAIEAEGITNPAVLAAMRKVPRHEFVAGSLKSQAYQDTSLPIGSQQTISPPYVVAYMTEVLDPRPGDKVLEIGTGSGYQAAVLAEIVREIYTIEIVSVLAKSATKRLSDLGYTNVHVKDGDGFQGWPEHAPFDKIIVTCSPEKIPEPLVEQLKEGGRMIIPVGERYQQAFHLLKKVDGKLEDERLISTLFVPMTGESESQRRIQPDPLRPQIVNGSFELDENADGRIDGWHYQRQTEISTDKPMHGNQALCFKNSDPGQLAQALQGTAIDGRRIAGIQLNYWVRYEAVLPGPHPSDQASVVVHFYDHVRREIGTRAFGRWHGTLGWQLARSQVEVPQSAREMIIRIGLNGATGTLCLDDMQLTTVPR